MKNVTQAEYEAKKLTENTGVEWRPMNDPDLSELYLISAKSDIYGIKRHRVMAKRKFGKCSSEYIELTTAKCRKFYQINELMLKSFPELFHDRNADDWKTIEIAGESSAYEVSSHGKVRRINNHRHIKPSLNSEGYLLIRMRHGGKTITEFLHRLVAKAFIPNPNGYELVNHIDENRQNDEASNLEWCDRSYNYKYSDKRRKVV